MDHTTLVSEQIDAGKEFLRLLDPNVLPVRAAFWLKEPNRDYLRLFIASDKMNETNLTVGFHEVFRVADNMRDPEIEPMRIRVIPGDAKVVKAVIELANRYPGKPIRRSDSMLGDVYAEEAYIYPSPLPAAATTP